MRQMEEAKATAVEFRQVVAEMQAAAKQLQVAEHAMQPLISIYSGCSQEEFEQKKDVVWRFAGSWVEDFVFTHAWSFPDLRRSELGELLKAVTQRRPEEKVDQVEPR